MPAICIKEDEDVELTIAEVLLPMGYPLNMEHTKKTLSKAYLIAAAPELLTSLEALVKSLESGNNGEITNKIDLAKVIINKAKKHDHSD